jgi:hypothetical protein
MKARLSTPTVTLYCTALHCTALHVTQTDPSPHCLPAEFQVYDEVKRICDTQLGVHSQLLVGPKIMPFHGSREGCVSGSTVA